MTFFKMDELVKRGRYIFSQLSELGHDLEKDHEINMKVGDSYSRKALEWIIENYFKT